MTRLRIASALAAALLGLFPVRAAVAAPPLRLTLDDALRLAAERNRDIQKALEYRNQLQGTYVEERAAAFPQVTAVGSWAEEKDSSQAALTGGRPVDPTRVATLEARLTQALYTGGKLSAAIRAAQVGLATGEDRLRLARQATARDVTAAFYDVLLAQELRAVAAQSLEQRRRHHDEARKRLSAGVATDYDVLAAEVAVANALPDLIGAENALRLAHERLRYLLALESEQIEVSGSLEIEEAQGPAFDEALRVAGERRPELAELRHQREVSRELVRIAEAGDNPQVDLQGNFGWRHLDVGTASEWGEEWGVALIGSWPLFDGFRTRGRVARAKSELATLHLEERKLLDSIALSIRQAQYEVAKAAETVRALAGTVGQAERLLYMAEKGFEYGVKTKLEIDDAELNLTRARTNLAQARRDYLVARTRLEWEMGVLGEDR